MGLKELLPSKQSNGGISRAQIDLATQTVLEEIVNKRRREMLLALEQQSGLTSKDLIVRVWELEQSRRESGPAKHSVHTSVTQNHIPRFVNTELVVSTDGPIRLTDRGESMAAIVRLLDSRTTEGDYS